MEDATKRKREVEAKVLDKVGEVISAIKTAKHVDQVVCALHTLALLLFPLDSSLFSGQSPRAHISISTFFVKLSLQKDLCLILGNCRNE
jgi:hypothetical protein